MQLIVFYLLRSELLLDTFIASCHFKRTFKTIIKKRSLWTQKQKF